MRDAFEADGLDARCGEPIEPQRQQRDQQVGEVEGGNGVNHQRRPRQYPVGRAMALPRGRHAYAQTDQELDQKRDYRQLERAGNGFAQDCAHGTVFRYAYAEVPPYETPQPSAVLDDRRGVETELSPDPIHRRGIDVGAVVTAQRISGRQMDGKERCCDRDQDENNGVDNPA